MTGFIRDLFGGKPKNPGEADAPVQAPQSKDAFFLSPDDAKTFGDIEYMRTSKTVRRTFAKKAGETEEQESIRQISAMASSSLEEQGVQPPKAARSQATFSQPTFSQPTFTQPAAAESPVAESPVAESPVAESPVAEQKEPAPVQIDTKPDTSLDMFRAMAKDIKRR